MLSSRVIIADSAVGIDIDADIIDDADVTNAYVDEPTVTVAIEVGWRIFG